MAGGAKVVGALPPLPMGQTALPLAAPPQAELKHVRHHDRHDHRLEGVEGLLEPLIDVVVSYRKKPPDENWPTSGANQ